MKHSDLFVLAIRQILLEKNESQVRFERSVNAKVKDIPQMEHYDGHIVPILTVTLPESVPADQRFADWTEDRIAEGIVLACEHRGYLYAELLTEHESREGMLVEWGKVLRGVYDSLRSAGDPDFDSWHSSFLAALDHGVPWPARVLRQRLLAAGFSEDFPCHTGVSHTVFEILELPGVLEPISSEFNEVWPCEDTVAFVDLSDNNVVVVIRDDDTDSGSSLTWRCRSLLDIHAEDEAVKRETLRRRLSVLLNESDEDHPVPVKIGVHEGEHDGDSVFGIFQVPGEGTIWFNLDGFSKSVDYDEMPLSVIEEAIRQAERA